MSWTRNQRAALGASAFLAGAVALVGNHFYKQGLAEQAVIDQAQAEAIQEVRVKLGQRSDFLTAQVPMSELAEGETANCFEVFYKIPGQTDRFVGLSVDKILIDLTPDGIAAKHADKCDAPGEAPTLDKARDMLRAANVKLGNEVADHIIKATGKTKFNVELVKVMEEKTPATGGFYTPSRTPAPVAPTPTSNGPGG